MTFFCRDISVNTVITDKDAIEGWRGWVFYDAECSLCVALAARFRGMLRQQRIDLVPLQAAGVPERLAIRPTDLLKEMRFLTQAGEVFGGAEAVAQVARKFWATRWLHESKNLVTSFRRTIRREFL